MEKIEKIEKIPRNLRGFKYCPNSGLIIRSRSNGTNHRYLGFCPITPSQDGYRRVRYAGKKVYQHRIAARLMGCNIEGRQMDHINGVRTDNRWSNLRVVTASENSYNKSVHRAGQAPGVYWNKKKKRWIAQRKSSERTGPGRQKQIGAYRKYEDAVAAFNLCRANLEATTDTSIDPSSSY